MNTHDAICNTFVVIAHDANFHAGWKQLHALFLITFHSFRQWIDIMLTKDGIHTLVNVVIVNSTKANLFCQYYITRGFVAFKVAQA
jgi:hypothetical protein